MHDRYCLNHISKCVTCKQPILNDDMEDHLESCGVKVNCKYCGLDLAKADLALHLGQCLKMPVNCQFCTMQLEYDDKEHEVNCGSRTELCPDCDEAILIKDYEDHLKNQCQKEKKITDCISIEKYIALQKKNKVIPYQNKKGSISMLNDLGLLYSKKKSELSSAEVKLQNDQTTMRQTNNSTQDHLAIIPKENDQILQKKLEKLKKKQKEVEEKIFLKSEKTKKNPKPSSCNFDDFQFIISYESNNLKNSKHTGDSQASIHKNAGIYDCHRASNTSNLKKGIVTSKYTDYYFD